MQKISTPTTKTDVLSENQRSLIVKEFQPRTETINKILSFASSYKVEKVSPDQYVELFLN